MKKFLALVLILVSLTSFALANVYPAVGVVLDVDHTLDFVAFENLVGEVWVRFGAEDWFIGDVAALLMDDAGTPEISDDKIVIALYAGVFPEK